MTEITPREAIETYLEDKKLSAAEATIISHRSRLNHFDEFCDEHDIESMSELEPMDCHRYKQWRVANHDIDTVTLKTQLDTLRVFLKTCARPGIVSESLAESVLSPTLNSGEDERESMLDEAAADAVLDYFDSFEYATREHVAILLAWRCLLRRGGLVGLDLQDLHLSDDEPYIEVRHRPETGTPLKRQKEGERSIGIRPETADIVNDYIKHNRYDVTEDRTPLLTSTRGRIHAQTLQIDCYAATRPCRIGQDCPHGRDIKECEAAKNRSRVTTARVPKAHTTFAAEQSRTG